MRRYFAYTKYVIRHKWFVLLASLRICAPIWRAIVHDLSKFLPSEFIPYAKTFYKPDGSKQYDETPAFNLAWLYHQRRNKHHWQYWVLKMDRGDIIPLDMPVKYIYEMVADWMGAGRAITGKWEAKEWYSKNKDKIQISEETRKTVEHLLERSFYLIKR